MFKVASKRSLTTETTRSKELARPRTGSKVQMNRRFAESFSIIIKTLEIGTEAILQLIAQIYFAIYNDFRPGPIQIFSMSTSFISIVLGTFYWNSDFQWDRKYRDGLKAIPLYVLAIVYKCLSLTTMVAILSYYSAVPIVLLGGTLAVVYYTLISDATNITKLCNCGNIIWRYVKIASR